VLSCDFQRGREAHKKANPSASVRDVAKIGGVEWKKVSVAEKTNYEALNVEARARY